MTIRITCAVLVAGAWLTTAAHAAATPQQLLAEARSTAARVEKKVQKLEDEDAIENLQRSYGFYIDKGRWQEAADLFADSGTLEFGGDGVFVGRQRIFQYLSKASPEGLKRGMLFNQMQLQPVVTVGADNRTAKGRWRFLAEVGEHQKSAMWGVGTYENEYVKENGVWKISRLHAYPRMYTPYADGWGKTALPDATPASDLTPDRPPSVKYEMYPATYAPPFHYAHPVTGKAAAGK